MTVLASGRSDTWRLPSPRRRGRALMLPAVALALLIAVLAAVVIADLVGRGSGSVSGAERRHLRAQVLAYQSAVVPVVRDVGSIEVQGMRAGLRDVRDAAPAALVQTQAWAAGLEADARKLAAVSVPSALARAHRLFQQSITDLIRAAHVFGRAALAPDRHRQALLARGIAWGERADRVYDAGSALLQAIRLRAGLSVTSDFPNPDAERLP